MNASECLKKLREIKDCSFASVDEHGCPDSRIIDVMIVEDDALYFCTARGKEFYQQLMANPHVAVNAMTKNYESIRVIGTAEKLEDQKKWIDRIFEENPVMNGVYPNGSRYILDPFVIRDAEVEYFDLSSEPINRAEFVIGNGMPKVKGFVIGDDCIECGTCAANCPQQCITEGTPYVIAQEHCLHCGLCFENCPVEAIVRRSEQQA